MEGRITTFRLQWVSCNLAPSDEIASEEISVYRKNHLMTVRSFNGNGKIIEAECIKTGKAETDKFFDFLKEIRNDLNSDYRIEMCDGSEWTIRMWDSTKKMQKVCGTVGYPPHGKEIEKCLSEFIENARGFSTPIMFGCSD